MLRSLSLRLRPGLPYDGPATYVDGNGEPSLRHGYYALAEDGKSLRRPLVRLTAVTAEDGSHHYESARKRDPHQRPFPGTLSLPARAVELELAAEGAAEIGAGEPVAVDPDIPRVACACGGEALLEFDGGETRMFRCPNCSAEQVFARE